MKTRICLEKKTPRRSLLNWVICIFNFLHARSCRELTPMITPSLLTFSSHRPCWLLVYECGPGLGFCAGISTQTTDRIASKKSTLIAFYLFAFLFAFISFNSQITSLIMFQSLGDSRFCWNEMKQKADEKPFFSQACENCFISPPTEFLTKRILFLMRHGFRFLSPNCVLMLTREKWFQLEFSAWV